MISQILGDMGSGIVSFLPQLAEAMFLTFVKFFFETSTEGGAVTGLNVLGEVSILFIIVGLSIRFVPTILSWLKLKSKNRRSRRAAK